MKKTSKTLFFIAVLFICSALGLLIFSQMYQPIDIGNKISGVDNNIQTTDNVESSTIVNQSVPIFNLPLLTSEDSFDASNLVNNDVLPSHPYLLNVWGSWCIACAQEHGMLKKIHSNGIKIVGVNYKDDVESANKFLADYGNPFELVVFDEMGDIGSSLGMIGAPESFLIDGKGIIRQHIRGAITEDVWNTDIQPCHEALVAHKDETTVQALCH